MNMKKLISTFERTIIVFLTFLMGIIVVISTLELAYVLFEGILNPAEGKSLVGLENLFEIFGLFFNVLIGFELFETMKLFFKENVLHAELILLVALIAVSRKVILLDFKTIEPLELIGVALLIGTITGGYYLIKNSARNSTDEP
ncbi:MAG: phosphate-starvation-inducible PsiE family protein [Chlorobi bacterium]|nr:phosphate-starvation-inducible PsiE family protein [Chlorobiota bacterium]